MNKQLQKIVDFLKHAENLSAEDKDALTKLITGTDKELNILEFKLERTEKVKRTTAFLLEETIEELEQKRKAVEAQNRELEIEAALEKVRSRTMAMQHSNELAETASLLFQQVSKLGVELWGCSFNIWEPGDTSFTSWWGGRDLEIKSSWYIPLTEDPVFMLFDTSRKRGDKLWIEEAGDKKLAARYKYMLGLPDVGPHLQGLLKAGITFPTFQIDHIVNFKHGNVLFITYEPCPQAYDIFKRFAKVFEQTYTRFLDLQKAEAQAREAQIEAALERIRAQSMAMHSSNELVEVVQMLDKQIQGLGIETDGSQIITDFTNPERGVNCWFARAEQGYLEKFHIPYLENSLSFGFWDAAKRKIDFYTEKSSKAEKNKFFRLLFKMSDFKKTPKERQEFIYSLPGMVRATAIFSNSALIFQRFNFKEFTALENEVFQRFGRVFEQAYTRFLDLQKAEAQAKEAQIEAALEKVRSRSMGMRKSEELADLSFELVKQVQALGVPTWFCAFNIYDNDPKGSIEWGSTGEGVFPNYRTPREGIFLRYYKAGQRGESLLINEIGEKECLGHYEYLSTLPIVGEQLLKMKETGIPLPTSQIDHVAFFKYGYILFITFEPEPEAHDIFKRFAKVFEQTYTRFLDLQKAEEQTREAQIEASLERVRSRSLAMRHSEELLDVITEIFLQLEVLEIPLDSCFINIYKDENPKDITMYIAAGGRTYRNAVIVPFIKSPIFNKLLESRKNSESFYSIKMDKKETVRWWKQFFANASNIEIPRKRKNLIAKSPGLASSVNVGKHASFHVMRYVPTPYSDEENQIFMRFGKVFDQAYTRFLDLQKAEEQAKEAQIEASLERIRSRSMAMQDSSELNKILATVFEELLKLNIELERSIIWIFNPEDQSVRWWHYNPEEESGTESYLVPYLDHEVYHYHWKAWEERRNKDLYILEGKNKETWDDIIFSESELSRTPKDVQKSMRAIKTAHLNNTFHDFGMLMIGTRESLSDDKFSIIERFGKVFDQSYTRFKDIQQAESRAKEAQIEATLERVRSRTMGMQKSEELSEVNQVIYEQLIELNFNIDGVGFAVDHRESDDWDLWQTDSSVPHPYQLHIPYFDHPLPNAIIEAKKNGLELFVFSLTFEEKNKLLDQVYKYVSQPQEVKKASYSFPGYVMSKVLFKNVDLYIHRWTDIPFTNAENAILIRFAKVLEQTYTRFKDLKQAEEQALEAVKRTSIDRVRAEIASMRTAKDLEQITPLIWKELTILNIPFIRCGVFIMDESKQVIHNYLSTPDGKAIAVFQLPYKTPGAIANILKHWQQRKIFLDHWDEDAMEEFANVLVDHGIFNSSEQYLKALPKEGFYLHFLPFNQGMLYVGNSTQLKDDEVQIIQSLANAFSTAYARYQDFNKLETAKQLVDRALVELKQTQQQLVQSEKMASLGELTAGIAHEIQNPLNFVNNFSEVSKELLEEMLEEMANGDLEEVKAIADDIIQNLDKINHHGKRADGIVKGMLQHSRASGDKKESTDINVLADEYLRLAYHGLRAKDKSFNAQLVTDFDASIKTIEIIPQDMGRVILNLLTNAFYVVNEKKKENIEGYEPTVSISTKKKKDLVEIKVMDNGNGIPKKVIDKIFQPFFTTKPTGQGTGLGLSMSYDIITKGHGGELKVKTNKGRGTTFTIIIPENKK